MSKEAILTKIRAAKVMQNEPQSSVLVKEHIKNDGDMYENFKTNLVNNKAIVYECQRDEVEAKVAEILKQVETKTVMFGSNLPLNPQNLDAQKLHFNKSVNELYEELFEADTSVIEAKLGVSNLGVLCITSSKEQPRLLSLLPTHCIVLLKKESLVDNLNDAFSEVSKGELPTNIIFIIGPSRTSDIELQVVLGVHGPQNLHVVLY